MFKPSPRLRLAAIVVAIASALTVAAVVAQPELPDRPPGVAAENWVPLGAGAALLIVERPSRRPVVTELWVKAGPTWHPALLRAPSNSVVLAK